MCGIVGYTGPREAYPVVVKGLRRLEYRGYDSAGVALLNRGLKVYKKKGKVADLEEEVIGKDLSGNPWRTQRSQCPPAPKPQRSFGDDS
jgi:glutamine---fructose-6-phosphate transaminase (isomerizing)